MSRTILYYPNIEVPTSGPWIRRALLYWDNVAAIVPRSYDDYMDAQAVKRFRPEVQELYDRQIFRPINPGRLFMDPTATKSFTAEWNRLNPPRIRRPLDPTRPICSVPIYKDKTSDHIFHDLEKRGLAEDRSDSLLYFFEPSTAGAYMTLLAKHMAAAQDELTVPATDRPQLSKLAFGHDLSSTSDVVLTAQLRDLVPVPDTTVPLDKVLAFREKHRPELLAFRAALDQFERELATAPDKRTAIHCTQTFKERAEKDILNLGKALTGFRVATVVGSLEAMVKANAPTIVTATAAVVTATATAVAAVPLTWVIGAASGAGLISLTANWCKQVQDRNKAIKDSAFAYIFLAQRRFGRP